MFKFNQTESQIEVAIINQELTHELKKELIEMEKETSFKYHYLYSYSLDISMIDTLIDIEQKMYIGEGTLTRLFYEKRIFNKHNLFKKLVESNAIITKKVEYIIKTSSDCDIKSIAKSIERKLISSYNPIFNQQSCDFSKSLTMKNNNIYILVQDEKVVDVAFSLRDLERDKLKKTAINRLFHDTSLTSRFNNYRVKKVSELTSQEKVQADFKLNNSTKHDIKEILDYFNIDSSLVFKEITE